VPLPRPRKLADTYAPEFTAMVAELRQHISDARRGDPEVVVDAPLQEIASGEVAHV